MMFRWIIIFLLFNFYQSVFAQSVRVMVYGGGNINFVFNSIAEFQSGVTLTNWTVLGIGVTEPVAGGHTGWTLSVSAEDADGDGFLTGTVPANKIPFADLQVRATPLDACVPCNFLGSPFVNLTTFAGGTTVIVNSTSDPACPCPVPGKVTNLIPASTRIYVSYRCGVSPLGGMMGKPADFYSDNLWFDLSMF